MNKYGFTDKEWNDILDILKQFPEIEKAMLFGSRAKNTFKPMSDVDIVLYGDKINHSAIAMLQSLFEDSQLPYFFDIIDYKTISSNELKEHIRLYGKIILGVDNIPKDDELKLPTGWIQTTLGEAVRIYSGKTRPNKQGTFPVYGGNGVLNYGDAVNQKVETIIVSCAGANCGNVFYDKENFWLSENALGIKTNDSSDLKFIYYKLISMRLNNYAIGGAQPLLTQSILKDLEINIPPLPEQKAIAAVLSAFDDKIELLREQSQTLETIAQTIFKEGFVRFDFPDKFGKPYRTSDGDIEKYPICYPNKNLLLSLNNSVSALISKIQNNICQIQTLAQTRDTLLPKLMNGGISVKSFKSDIIDREAGLNMLQKSHC